MCPSNFALSVLSLSYLSRDFAFFCTQKPIITLKIVVDITQLLIQVMCNAEVTWVPWRAGSMRAAAVRVAPDVFVGRVLYHGNHLVGAVQPPTYRCHVVIYDRPFAFSCFELLIIATASTSKSTNKSVSSRDASKR